jgi:hypothetical protein
MPAAPGVTPTGETWLERMMPSASSTNCARSLVPA